jgi:hypothetical protein
MKPVLQAKEFEGYFWIPAHIHVEEVTKAYEAGAAAEREACAVIANEYHGIVADVIYDRISARSLNNINKEAEKNGEEL